MADDDDELEPKRRVFINNIDDYFGRTMKSYLEGIAESPFEVIGTLSNPKHTGVHFSAKPVKDDPESLKQAVLSSEWIFLDIVGHIETVEQILDILSTAELESQKVLIGLSSVMTWSKTAPDKEEPDKPLTEEEYKRRRPHPSFKDYHTVEKLVVKTKQELLRSHVVAPGLMYGEGEELLHSTFKLAWQCSPVPLLSLADGQNTVPTIHVRDTCQVLYKMAEEGCEVSYVMAVDGAENQTLSSVVEAVAEMLGNGNVVNVPKDEVRLNPDADMLQVDLKLESVTVKELGIEWVAETGLVNCMNLVVEQYRQQRGIQPLKVLLLGPPASGKTKYSERLSEEYGVPVLQTKAVLDEMLEKDVALSEEAATAKDKEGRYSDEFLVKVFQAKLQDDTSCRNQGFILDGFPKTYNQALLLFGAPKKVLEDGEEPEEEPEEEAAEDEDGEDGEQRKKKKKLDVTPEFVIQLEAPQETLLSRLQDIPEVQVTGTHNTEDGFQRRYSAWKTVNSEDSPTTVLRLLEHIEMLPLDVTDNSSWDRGMKQARIYMGKPRNFGPSEEELKAKEEAAKEEAEEAAKKQAEEAAKKQADEKEQRRLREEEEMARLVDLQQQERELLEVRSIPLRNYLMENVIPTLTEGMIEVCKLRPEDPVDYLAEWLFHHNPMDETHM